VTAARPFYAQFGWAYDHLVDDPVEPWVEAVEAALSARASPLPARILDAGCGTGRHAAAFAKRGHVVALVDSSQELLNQARQRMPAAPAVRAKLETLALGGTFDAIVCRGVLNDICSDHGRTDVLRRFASHLSGGGLVVLDVRELGGTRRRYGGGRVSRRERSTPRGLLTFETVGRMDDALCGSRSSIISTPPPGSESLSVSSP
jgi:SAM-dependent methyltransferase